jgi:hypothetical protein
VIALAFIPRMAIAPARISPAAAASVLALGALGTGIAYVWSTGIVASWGAVIVIVGVLAAQHRSAPRRDSAH